VRKSLLLVLAVAFALSLTAWGATVKLKDGSELQGEIVENGKTSIKIKVGEIELEVEGDMIESVDGKAYVVDVRAAYDEMLKALDDSSADAHCRLASWCRRKGLKAESKVHLRRALSIDPAHKDANLGLGRVYVEKEQKWLDPAEAQKKGYQVAKKSGRWVTESEALEERGFQKYKGAYLSAKEIEEMKAREFSRWKNYYYTHSVCDLKAQLPRIALYNKLNLSKEQMEEFFLILAEAEQAKAMFLDTRHEVNMECERAWNHLKFENNKGVYRGFDTPSSVQRPAGAAEKAYKHLPKGYTHTLSPYLRQVEKVLAQTGPRTSTKSQLFAVDHGYCMCCHKDMAGCSECAGCHRGSRKVTANSAGVAAICEVRAMSGAEWAKAKEKIIRTWIKPVTGKNKREMKMREMEEYASIEQLFTRVRDLDATAFENQKALLASQLAAKTDIDRTRLEREVLMAKRSRMSRAHETEAMMADCFFDGTMFEILGGKLKRKSRQLPASAGKARLVEQQAVFDGKAMVEEACTKCHTVQRIHRRMKRAPMGAEWHECVKKMLMPLPPNIRAAGSAIADYLIELESKNAKDEF